MRHIDFGWPRARQELGLPRRTQPFQPPQGASFQKPLSEQYGRQAEKEASGLGSSVVRKSIHVCVHHYALDHGGAWDNLDIPAKHHTRS